MEKTEEIVTLTNFFSIIQFFQKLILITKIRPQAKIDNFAFKNSNIIIEGLI